MTHLRCVGMAALLVLAACSSSSDGATTSGGATTRCGDGRVDAGEPCDGGGETPTCNLDCTLRSCGDGKVNAAAGEQCDRGAANADDADCTAACQVNVCGDGKQNRLGPAHVEPCDDGNQVDTDGCSNGCRLASCGNGVLDPGEQCDDANAIDTDGCVACLYARCGDGAVRAGVEACDDGNTAAGDGCSPTCTVEACGNGLLDSGEECDDANTVSGDGCSGTASPLGGCRLERCGDGVVNAGEACDRAATPATCNLDCTSSSCGDGKVNPGAGEQCDDANDVPTDGCHLCRLTRCGNGVLDPGEECDGAVGAGPFGCSPECFQVACGNGRLDPGEECDDGNGSDADHCTSGNPDPSTCKLARCGDGHVDTLGGAEACDDGAANSYSGACLPTCRPNVCGDGFRNVAGLVPEACDDGNTALELACPYGTQSCTVCDSTCTALVPRTGNVCGDGVFDAAHEACDDGNSGTEPACPYGTATCTVCSASCTLVARSGSVCGDGVVDAVERCDDRNALGCGTCSGDCQTVQLARATGFIVATPGADLPDGATFTLDDGLGTIVVFEFDRDGSSTGVPILLTGAESAAAVAVKIQGAVNAEALRIDAVSSGALVQLAHQAQTALGNTAIAVTSTPPGFFVSGMSGGAGGDCAAGVGCAFDADCASGVCALASPRTCE